MSPQDYDLEFDPKAASLYLGNLFNGNKLLGEVSSKSHSGCFRRHVVRNLVDSEEF